MIELRPRKPAKRHLSVSGSDRPEGDASEEGAQGNCAGLAVAQSCQQVVAGANGDSVLVKKKRGRKPKIRTPVKCKEASGEIQIGLDEVSGKEDGLHVCSEDGFPCGKIKTSVRKSELVGASCCAQQLCASEVLCPKKKRGRKPKIKQSECEITTSVQGQSCVTVVPKEISIDRVTSESLSRLTNADVDEQAGSTQNSVATRQVKRRGRKPTAKQSECDITTSGQSCVTVVPEEISNGRVTSESLSRLTNADVDEQAGSTQNSVATRQVKRRGRKPTTKQSECDITTSGQSCVTVVPEEISNGRVTSESLSRLTNADVDEAGSTQNSVATRQVKRRGRKPTAKQSECAITSGQSCVTVVPNEISNGRVTSESLSKLCDVDEQSGNTQNSVVTGQVKRLGRKSVIHPSAKCDGLESGNTNKQEQASVCNGGGSWPERKKRGRKAGSLLWKAVKRAKKRLKRNAANLHPELPHGDEETCSTRLTCLKKEPRNSRRTKQVNPVADLEKLKIPVTAEPNTNCLRTACEQSSVLKVEEKAVKCKMVENSVKNCLTKTCHVHAPNLPNPVVMLQNCKRIHRLHFAKKTPVELGSVLTALNIEHQMSLIDNASSGNTSIPAVESVKHNEKVVESTSDVNNQNDIKTFLKVKLNFKKRARKSNSRSEESDSELSSVDCGAKEEKHEGHRRNVECIAKPNSANSHDGTLMDKLNNNTIVSGLNFQNERDKVATSSTFNPLGSWRTQTHFVSDEEISDHDFDTFSSLTVCTSNFPPEKEVLAVDCQRVIPFTGKRTWKCSCARTYVSTLPRKRPAAQNKIVLGIEPERSLEIYSDDKHALFESTGGESMSQRTKEDDREAVCKKRKLDLHFESTSLHYSASCVSPLDESLSNENKNITDALLSTGERSDTRHYEPLASVSLRKYMDVECSEHLAQSKVQNDKCRLQRLKREDQKHLLSKPPSKTVTEIDQKTGADPFPFKIPTEETRILLHGGVPDVFNANKDLQNEVSSTSTPLEEVDTCVLNDNLKNRNNHSEDGKSNYGPSEWFEKEEPVEQLEACDPSTLARESTKPSANIYTFDVLKAYEEDILVLDVIQDDPELFGFSSAQETSSSKKYCNTNSNVFTSKPNIFPLISKVQKKAVSPAHKSKTGIKRIEYIPKSSTDSINDFFDASSDNEDTCISLPETNEKVVRTHTEMEESRSPAEWQDQDTPQELHHANILKQSKSSPPFQEVLLSKHFSGPQCTVFHHPKAEPPIMNNSPPPRMHDFHTNRKETSPEVSTSDSTGKRKHEKLKPRVQQSWLPFRYCRYFFNTFGGCVKRQCEYLHIPKKCDEKICMDLLRKLINEKNAFLLRRAVWIFANYYSLHPPWLHYDQDIFGELLNPLLNQSMWQDVFHLLETAAIAKILPSLDQIIKVFESVAFSGLQTSFSALLDLFCKFVRNGLNITPVEINHIIAIMSKSNAAKNHINILLSMKSRLEMKLLNAVCAYDLDAAMSEVEHCKVNSDWMKLGTLYLTVCTGCENLTNLKNFSRCIAEALMKDSINERPEIPYCEFADTIFKNPQFNDIQKNILGRIGVSVLFFYHRKELWLKGRKVIHKFHELKINYTILKGLSGQEGYSSRCHVVNIAVEIFLKSGNLGSAVQTLKESEWIINTSMWPCDMMDVLHRHNLLCLLVTEALSKNMFNMCFDVLQNLPGIQESQADLNVSQYAVLFNKVLRSCVENRSIGISSSIIDFMIAKKIAIDYLQLREFLTILGHSGLWTKARGYYKSATALGFYPLFEGKMNQKILHIPSLMSDVEMLMTIEHFMVANASSIQSQGGCSQSLQIVLKRMEEDNAKCKDNYRAAAERLSEASRLSNPRLFIKHMTVNNTNEQVYILDHNSSLKWLNENIKWAGNVWYYH
ncbi:protein TOPAZ1 isoform X2 [Rhinoderma darwinii]|uniref:protein TOPAZ1 isoform X2 n=1 Tax=Rhinoderma darwinii TaxID=43563 RepID=UPI003F673ACE